MSMKSNASVYRVAVDPKEKRIYCVLLQAAFGCDMAPVHLFRNWKTNPPQGKGHIAGVKGTMDEFRKLAEAWNVAK